METVDDEGPACPVSQEDKNIEMQHRALQPKQIKGSLFIDKNVEDMAGLGMRGMRLA